jgi:hypothetical protein
MEGRSKSARNESLAAVVRQFNPSRIERELLAQAFEVVVAGAFGDRGPSASRQVSEGERWVGSDPFESETKPTVTRSVA